jgi:hypothetical protein
MENGSNVAYGSGFVFRHGGKATMPQSDFQIGDEAKRGSLRASFPKME